MGSIFSFIKTETVLLCIEQVLLILTFTRQHIFSGDRPSDMAHEDSNSDANTAQFALLMDTTKKVESSVNSKLSTIKRELQ